MKHFSLTNYNQKVENVIKLERSFLAHDFVQVNELETRQGFEKLKILVHEVRNLFFFFNNSKNCPGPI